MGGLLSSLSRTKSKLGLNPGHWAPSPRLLPGSEEAGSGGVFENSLSSSSHGLRPPTSNCVAKAFVGKPWGREASCWPIHHAGGLASASPQHRLGFPSWGCQRVPTRCHSPLPSSVVSWSLRALALVPAEGWRGAPAPVAPTPRLSHAGTRAVGTLTAAGHRCPALPTPSLADLKRGEEQPAPKTNPSRMGPSKSFALIMNLGTNKAFASQLVTELSQERVSSRLSFRQGHMLGHLVPPPVSALLEAQGWGWPSVLQPRCGLRVPRPEQE